MRLLSAIAISSLASKPAWGLPSGTASHDHHTDWSVAIVDSTMARLSPESVGDWQYPTALFLLGQYEVYKRTGRSHYLSYIQSWADRFVNDDGLFNVTIDSLDSIQPANVLVVLYNETGEDKYKKAASQVREHLKTYPRTRDGAFWHAFKWVQQLWADGTFMVNPFLIRYAALSGESDYANDETTKQLLVYSKHLQVENGLLQHGYDALRAEEWADPETGRSAEQWCRAMGWYGLAMMDILDLLPEDHPQRDAVISSLGRFAAGVKKYQDRKSGRWFQIVNKGDLEENWTETSCSAMFTTTLSRAIASQYISRKYAPAMWKGYAGVLERVQKNSDGLTDVSEICVGTNVGELQFYLDRPRETNDQHGLGAVLLMNEQVAYGNGL